MAILGKEIRVQEQTYLRMFLDLRGKDVLPGCWSKQWAESMCCTSSSAVSPGLTQTTVNLWRKGRGILCANDSQTVMNTWKHPYKCIFWIKKCDLKFYISNKLIAEDSKIYSSGELIYTGNIRRSIIKTFMRRVCLNKGSETHFRK